MDSKVITEHDYYSLMQNGWAHTFSISIFRQVVKGAGGLTEVKQKWPARIVRDQ